MRKSKRVYSEEELADIIDRVVEEIATQEKYNTGKEPEWISEDAIMARLYEYIGSDWEVVSSRKKEESGCERSG